jgi:molybdopterin molybdotransferase
MKALLLDVKSAREIVLDRCLRISPQNLPTETLHILECYRRIIAESILLDRDQPPFDRSMRDGYAVRAEDAAKVPASLQCVGEIKAGDWPLNGIDQGQAVQIMTGAPIPGGADAVVMAEHTEQPRPGIVRILKSIKSGDNIATQGSEHRIGSLVLAAGRVLSTFELAVLASVGKATVKVFRRPTVAILATGDELVEIQEIPGPGRIRNSNSFSLWAQVLRYGGLPRILGIAHDDLPDLKRQITLGLQSDVLLISGGVSMGKYDLVEPVLKELGIEVHFESVSMRPGKPTVFASCGNQFVFGLPGNPVSTFVAFELFVRPVLQRLQGLEASKLGLVRGTVQQEVIEKSGRTAFLPAMISSRSGKITISPVSWKGSADIFSMVGVNALLIVPLEATHLKPGDSAEAILFDEPQFEFKGEF